MKAAFQDLNPTLTRIGARTSSGRWRSQFAGSMDSMLGLRKCKSAASKVVTLLHSDFDCTCFNAKSQSPFEAHIPSGET